MPSFTPPVLYNPFRTLISPHYAEVARLSLEWIVANGLACDEARREHVAKWDIADMAARVYCQAPLEGVFLACIFNQMIAILDDQFDDAELGADPAEAARSLRGFMRLLTPGERDRHSPANLAERAWNAFWDRVLALSPPAAWQHRFMRHMREYLHSAISWQARVRRDRSAPDLLTYIEHRRDNGVMRVESDLIELAYGVWPPEDFLDSRIARLLQHVANDVVCVCNDIYSYDKEMARDDFSNGVFVYRQLLQCSVQEAVDGLGELLASRIRDFEQTREELPAFFAAQAYREEERFAILRYVDGLASWISGFPLWSRHSRRYSEVEYEPAPGTQAIGSLQNILEVQARHLIARGRRRPPPAGGAEAIGGGAPHH